MSSIYPLAIALTQRYKVKPYSLTDKSIDTIGTLKESNCLVISTLFSDKTIYPCASLNWLFRAHHDSLHLKYRLGFSLDEEIEVTRRGISELGLDTNPLLADLYWQDNVGQQLYYYSHGGFPDNQLEYISGILS